MQGQDGKPAGGHWRRSSAKEQLSRSSERAVDNRKAKGAHAAIEETFKRMVCEMPYDKITVSAICEKAGVTRKVFYARYTDKDAIIDTIFRRDVIKPLGDLNKLVSHERAGSLGNLMFEMLYDALYADREFYEALVRPVTGRSGVFVRVVIDAIYDFNLDLLPKLTGRGVTWETDYVAFFFASSQAMLMRKWLADRCAVPPHDLADLYRRMTMSFWTGEAKNIG